MSSVALPSRLLLLAVAGAALCSCAATDSLFKRSDRSGSMINGKATGPWIYRYPSGAKMAQGSYVADHQIGRWDYWFENGNLEWQGEFGDARLEGPSASGYEAGEARCRGMYANGFEEDHWTFWTKAGKLDQEGDYVGSRRNLRWTYYHEDGSPMGEGFMLDGQRVGLWQYYGPDGEVYEEHFPLPGNMAVVFETWDETVPRREGFLTNGKPNGRWVTWHANGRRRLTCDLVDGVPSGLLVAWKDDGTPLAMGNMERGRPTGDWRMWRHDGVKRIEDPRFEATFAGSWSRDGQPRSEDLDETLAAWVGELTSPLQGEPIDQAPRAGATAPPAHYLANSEVAPVVPLRAQPWTVAEEESFDYLVARYTDGAKDVEPPKGSRYGGRRSRSSKTAPAKATGDPVLSPKWLGKPLPWTRFFTAEGKLIDLRSLRGKRVVLVVLRGFAREVCIYCITQTKALCLTVDDFRNEDCEVFVVYPGEQNRLEAFLDSFRKASKDMGEVPIGVLYDPNLQLVELMGISSEMAIPSTFVLDEEGVIRYSYVGQSIEDRPPAEDILEAVRAFPSL